MLKVLHVEGGANYYGGARQVALLAEGLARRGHESVVVCPRGTRTARRLEELPVRLHPLPMRGDIDLTLIPQLVRILRSERPDILHLHSRRGPEILGAIAGLFRDVPIVYSRRNDHPESPRVARVKYRLYDRIIAISDCIRQILADSGVPPRKIRVVRDGFQPDPAAAAVQHEATLREVFDLPPNAFVIGVIAQLIERKGHAVLLEAVPRLLAELPQLRVVFFGDGPLEEELRAAIAAAGIEAVVHLAGYREDLPQLLRGLDLVVHPALTEGLGVSLLDASHAGLAIVATRTGGIPEAVHDGVSGLLVEPGESQPLTDAILALAAQPARRAAMGAAGRRLIIDAFSVDAMVEGNLEAYLELLATPR